MSGFSGNLQAYTDFGALAALRADARQDQSGALPLVAAQFESLFLQMMLKSMRETVPDSGLLGGASLDLYQDLFDRQISQDLGRQGSVGIADLLVRQLGGLPDPASPPSAPAVGALPATPTLAPVDVPQSSAATRAVPAAVRADAGVPDPAMPRLRDRVHPPADVAAHRPAAPSGPEPGFDGPDDFVRALWPHAREAGAVLGVEPAVLVAQSALETGWGRHVIRDAAGSSSHNLFGIKADSRWPGARVRVPTMEVQGGVMRRVVAEFRAYESYQQSFRDYVSFLRANPRYQDALASVGDPAGFATALQNAGYATDPRYAQKIVDILGRELLANIKGPGAGPL
jgi:flagellar protein FlgJ